MEKFILPRKILGTIKVTSNKSIDEFFIGEANLAIEQIGKERMLNIWANSYHYELHNDKEVLVGDVGFEIMQPIEKEVSFDEPLRINFPNNTEAVENNWEELYYGHFYQFEHLKIVNWEIKIFQVSDGEVFNVESKGYITDDIHDKSKQFLLECSFQTKLKSKIDSRFNWNYSLANPNAKNRN